MRPRIVAWLAIVLTALALVPAGAHLLELPSKMKLADEAYFMVQNIYRGWAWLGIVLVAVGTFLVLISKEESESRKAQGTKPGAPSPTAVATTTQGEPQAPARG